MFNGLLKTHLGPVETDEGLHYLRPETAQGIFTNFLNVQTTSRRKPPFGIGQIGKSFRNEITPGNFIFRTREFEQMEMEFFVEPGTDEEWHQYWIDERTRWYTDLGISKENLRHYEHPQGEAVALLEAHRRHRVPLPVRRPGVGRAGGHRQPHRLRPHHPLERTRASTCRTSTRPTNSRYRPFVIEPAAGVGRPMMAFLLEAYTEDEAPNAKGGVDKRVVLRLDRRLAPVKAAVLPLSRNADLSPKAKDLANALRKHWNIEFDDAGAIGRRYRRQDEIGTPFCVTVDFDTLDRPRRDGAGAGHDVAGAGVDGPAGGLPRRPSDRRLTRRFARWRGVRTAHAAFPLERRAQRERGAVADLAGHRGRPSRTVRAAGRRPG